MKGKYQNSRVDIVLGSISWIKVILGVLCSATFIGVFLYVCHIINITNEDGQTLIDLIKWF